MATGDFTIADVLAWARTKPADEPYKFSSPKDCALGQYAREERGFSDVEAACEYYRPHLSGDLIDAALGRYGRWPDFSRQTFGQLVKRLETLCPTAPVTSCQWAAIDAYLTDIEQVAQVSA